MMKNRRLFAALVPMVIAASGCGYNQIQTLDEQAASAKQNIQTQLQRRYDLIPNLVNTVKGYAAQETTIFTNIANARARLGGAIQSGDPGQMAQANQAMNGALGRLLVVVENYPELKSNQNFLQLQDELTGTENRLATARNDYNEAVRQYNAYIRRFPQNLTAKVTGAQPRTYYEATAEAQGGAPTVDFSPPAGTAAPAPAPGAPAPGAPSGAPPTPAPAGGQ